MIASFLNSLEDLGLWPSAVSKALIHLLLKPSGDRRPIGLIDGLIKLWEGCRKPLVQRWREGMNRPYDASRRGRRITEALWRQALQDEVAQATGLCSITALLDLTKAFEHVPLDKAWANGVRTGFPLKILRLALEAFAMARHLTFQGVTAPEGVTTLTAIVAGTSFAPDVLFLVLHEPVDQIRTLWPTVWPSMVMDDLALQIVATQSEVQELALKVLDTIISMLEDLGGIVSRGRAGTPGGKTVMVTASAPLAHDLQEGAAARGVAIVSGARNLGHDYTAGGPAAEFRDTTASRLAAMQRLQERLRHLGWGRRAQEQMLYGSLAPKGAFATDSFGMADAELRILDQAGHASLGPTTGRSAYARLRTSRGLPSEGPALKPAIAWCTQAFEPYDDRVHEHMGIAWKAAVTAVGLANDP